MTTRLRLVVLGSGAALLAAILLWGLRGAPAVGTVHSTCADTLNRNAQQERNVTDVVTAVNFDYRAIDTVGEEYILFISVAAVAVVLRRVRGDERKDAVTTTAESLGSRRPDSTSDAVRIASLLMVAPAFVLGVYIMVHGQLSPGGGFQGGIILATAFLFVYLGGRYRRLRQLAPHDATEVLHGAGAAGFVLIGVAALLGGSAFLVNFLPLGHSSDLTAGGTIPLISLSIGIEVAGGVMVMLGEFLEQTVAMRERAAR